MGGDFGRSAGPGNFGNIYSRGNSAGSGTRNGDIPTDLLDRLERRYGRLLAEAERQAKAAESQRQHALKPSRREATLETWTKRSSDSPTARVRQSPLVRMFKLGKVSREQLWAAQEIASVAEMIESDVGYRSASLEGRVDNSGAGRDALVEGLKRVRLEVAYRAWSKAIPMPRRMIIDMIVMDSTPYTRIAARYGLHWRTARKRLLRALNVWQDFRDLAEARIGRDDISAVHERIMGGRG